MRIRNSLANIITGTMGQLVLTITGFITRTIFIYTLGATYLGVNGLFSNILTVLSLAELGIGQAIIFSLYKPIAENDEEKICSLMKLYAQVYRTLFVIVLVLGMLLLPFLPYIISDIDTIPNIRIIYVMYIINSAFSYLFSYRGAFLTACQKNYLVNTVGFASNITMTIVQIIGLLVFKNYFVYLGVQISFGIVQNLVIYIYSTKLYPFLNNKNVKSLESSEKKKIKDNVGALILYKVGNIALNSTDNIIISSFLGIVTVGLYSNYLLLQTTVNGFLSTIFGNLTASIGNLNVQESNEKKYFIFRVINLATFWLYSVCVICLFVCMTPFIQVWIGKDYVLPISVSLIIAINMYIAGMLFAPFNFRQTMGLFVEGKMRPIISAIINIVVSIVFALWWGLPGVLWGTAVARLTTNVWFDPYLVFKRGMNISPRGYYWDYIMKLIQFVCIGLVCTYLSSLVVLSNIWGVLLKAIIAFGVSNICVLLLYSRTEEFDYLFNIIKNFKGIMKK